MPADPALVQRAASARVARLATVAASGAPHIVPITFVLHGDDIYTAVDAKPKRTTELARLANMRRDPRVGVLVDHYDDDWSALWWVRFDGMAQVIPEGRQRDVALELLAEKYAPYRERRPEGPVVAVRITASRSWAHG